MKQYAVEVMTKHSNGRYGKERYCVWCLSETSKAKAESFASEILAGMTWREILEDKWGEMAEMHMPMFANAKMNDTIGYENAEAYFSFKASLI
jgi:hypothetical protein